MNFVLFFLLQIIPTFAIIVNPRPTFKNDAKARAGKDQRREEVLQKLLKFPLAPVPTPPKINFQDFFITALPQMALNVDVESMNKTILNPNFIP